MVTITRVKLPKSFLAVNVSEAHTNDSEQGQPGADDNMH